MAQAYVLLNCE